MKRKEDCKKAQASMEFLMTYGWAILLVIVVISALSYFGVLKFSKLLPESCVLMPGLGCEEFVVTPEGMILFVRNGMGESLRSASITVVGSEDNKCVGASASINTSIANGDLGRFNIYCVDGPEENSRFVSDLLIEYTSDNLTHISKGRIIAFVQGLSGGGLDEGVCENADPELCSGLDIVFGEGYQAACCEEFELCC